MADAADPAGRSSTPIPGSAARSGPASPPPSAGQPPSECRQCRPRPATEPFSNVLRHGPTGGRVLVGYCLWQQGVRPRRLRRRRTWAHRGWPRAVSWPKAAAGVCTSWTRSQPDGGSFRPAWAPGGMVRLRSSHCTLRLVTPGPGPGLLVLPRTNSPPPARWAP